MRLLLLFSIFIVFGHVMAASATDKKSAGAQITQKASIVRAVITHLGYLGYSVSEPEDNGYLISHINWFDMSFIEGETPEMGLVFGGRFGVTQQAKKDHEGFMKFINDLNTASVVTKFYRDSAGTGDMLYQAWYPGAYDKDTFAIFIGFMQKDVYLQFSMHKDTEKYITQ